MSMPQHISERFPDVYEGMPAARFRTSNEALDLEIFLRWHKVSYRTCVRSKKAKSKREGPEFIVTLLEQADYAAGD